MLSPLDVTPPLSKAFRYSMATDLRCSSVIVCVVSAMGPAPPIDAFPCRDPSSARTVTGGGLLLHQLDQRPEAPLGVDERDRRPAASRARGPVDGRGTGGDHRRQCLPA